MPGTLEGEAQRRKERLALLKKRKQPDEAATAATQDSLPISPSQINHRNYDPETQTLRRSTAITKATAETAAKDSNGQAAVAAVEEEETVEFVSQAIALQAIEDAKNAATAPDNQLDLFNLQPKKPNWDLKRDLKLKLDRLQPRMDAAVAQLLRERIAAASSSAAAGASDIEQSGGNLAQVVNQMEEQQRREMEV